MSKIWKPVAASRLLFVVMKISLWLLDYAIRLISGYCGNFETDTFINYNLTHIRHFNKTTDVCY